MDGLDEADEAAGSDGTLVALSGLVASGKSTVARALAGRLDATRLEADEIRRALLEEEDGGDARDVLRHFDRAIEDRVYARLLREAGRLLWSGQAVVLDAGFPTREARAAARSLARQHGLRFLLVECRVDPETAKRRLSERDRAWDDSGWSDLYALFADHFEAVDELDASEHVIVDATRPVDEILRELERRLGAQPPEAAGSRS